MFELCFNICRSIGANITYANIKFSPVPMVIKICSVSRGQKMQSNRNEFLPHKGTVIPVQALKKQKESRNISTLNLISVSGQQHSPTTLHPEKSPRHPTNRKRRGPQSRITYLVKDNNLFSCRRSSPSRSSLYRSHYNNYIIPLPVFHFTRLFVYVVNRTRKWHIHTYELFSTLLYTHNGY